MKMSETATVRPMNTFAETDIKDATVQEVHQTVNTSILKRKQENTLAKLKPMTTLT